MNAKTILVLMLLGYSASTTALTLSQSPLFIASTESRVMLLMSRDHELSKKAYTDYTDLNLDGGLDITYSDTVNYYGYFDSNKCYQYSTTNNRFEPTNVAGGLASPNNHQCSSRWSGNFLNWATMTRLDILRKVLYGGFRSTDNTGTALGTTVLERAFLPPDVHAFAKVYAPAAGATDIAKFTPYNTTATISICNVTDMGAGVQAGSINTVNGTPTNPPPLIKVASGAWAQWATTEILQCQWKEDTAETSPRPTKASNRLTGSSDLIARVAVCVPGIGPTEDKCKSYATRAATPVVTVKPTGLLQQYGDVDVDRRTRFGLMTGSYKKNVSGGVLRKNISLITNNTKNPLNSPTVCGNNNAKDEIDVCTGQFINQTATSGIINTINRIHIAGYKTPGSGAITSTQVCSNGYNNSSPYDCSSGNLLSGTNGTCPDWGNPLSEMYHEALRYFAGKTGASAAYSVDDSTVISSLGQATWNASSDPLPATEWCALSNVIVLSTGLTSLDNAAITTDITGLDATALTNDVGAAEGVNGNSFLIGSNGTISNNLCSAKTLTNLSSASGICPELPHMKGGFLISGLANANRSLDLRPEYLTKRTNRWTGINADWVARQPLGTYTVGLAENLPSFKVTAGSGVVTLVPACRSNGSTNCSLNDLKVESYSATKASFLIAWEDGTAGSDYDMDSIERLEYCVGAACSPALASNQVKVKTSVVQSATGSGMELGYTVSGTGADGTIYPIKIPGTATCNPTECPAISLSPLPLVPPANYSFFSLLSSPAAYRCVSTNVILTCPGTGTDPTTNPAIKLPFGIVNATGCPSGTNCGCPKEITYTSSSTPSAGLLKNPLWYTAKYGTPASKTDLKNNNTGALVPDGEPDNFFDVRNPAKLYQSLAEVFDQATQPDSSAASAATNSTSLRLESRIYQAKFSSIDWSGQLLSYLISNGVLTTPEEWDSGQVINGQDPSTGRVILSKGSVDGVGFAYNNLTTAQQGFLDKDALAVVDNCGVDRVAYLRGDATNEGNSTATFPCSSPSTSTITKFRQRSKSKLGDIVNSSPLYVSEPSAGYAEEENPGYGSFRRAHLNRKPIVYVSANDGMLHGFDASLTGVTTTNPGTPTADGGKEVLAYIPSLAFPNLSKLTDQSYNKNHLYFTDGSPMSADIDINSSTSVNDWRTVLVSGMGAGAKGYFALDITNAANFSESGAAPANTLLWEFDETDMGFAFNLPPTNSTTNQAKQIVKLANGKWAVILGNGYNSVAGKAVLYIVFIEEGLDGAFVNTGDFVKIVADAPVGLDNGLSTPTPYDSDGDGVADTVYAGDLKGNLWKFLIGPNCSDTSSSPCDTTTSATSDNPSTWRVAFSGTTCAGTAASPCTPLFTAKDSGGVVQPIISPAEVVFHPNGGQLVLFGTGKFLESSDISNAATQTFYGIWDKHNNVTTVGARNTDLLKQQLSDTACAATPVAPCTLTTAAGVFRIPTKNFINWRQPSPPAQAAADCTPTTTCNPTHMGWYIDLPTSKERTTGRPSYINKVIFFNTLIPSEVPCDGGGTGWLMALDYLNGGLKERPIFDTNNSGTFTSSDTLVAGYQVGASIGGTTLIKNPSSVDNTNIGIGVTSKTSGALGVTDIDFGTDNKGRLSWQEIVQ